MTTISNHQIEAFKEISQNGERLYANDLNIARRTFNAMVRKGWVAVDGGKAFITQAGHDALTRAGI